MEMWNYHGILDITETQITIITVLQLLNWYFSLEKKKKSSPLLSSHPIFIFIDLQM